MKKHGSGPLSDFFYGTFSDTILMVGADSRKRKSLVLVFNICFEFMFPKTRIISTRKMFYLDIELLGKTLKLCLPFSVSPILKETWFLW
jgi:hypothetical protein